MKSTILPTFCIILAASLLGLGFNGVRSKDSINIQRNYFQTLELSAKQPEGEPAAQDPVENEVSNNPFPAVTLDEMVDLYQSPEYGTGATVFVDARDDEHYEEGHIPDALHVDRYNSDAYFKKVQSQLEQADVIVVYCSGGECEDSIFLATEFVTERMIPISKVRVFEGGMDAWEGDNLDTEEGLSDE